MSGKKKKIKSLNGTTRPPGTRTRKDEIADRLEEKSEADEAFRAVSGPFGTLCYVPTRHHPAPQLAFPNPEPGETQTLGRALPFGTGAAGTSHLPLPGPNGSADVWLPAAPVAPLLGNLRSG